MTRIVPGNALTLLKNGDEFFPALQTEILRARLDIYVETYIYADDAVGCRIAEALVAACKRGVSVRILVDGFGSRYLAGTILQTMEQAGVQVLVYRPEIAHFDFHRERLMRMHRKLVLIDGRVAFVGGINIIDDYNTPGHTPPRIDYAVRVTGPLVADIDHFGHRLWVLLSWTHFRRRWPAPPALPTSEDAAGGQAAAIVIRDNLRHRSDIEEAYLSALAGAKGDVVIACAYFLPGTQFRRALIAAAARGVRVRLLLQARVEYIWLHYASRALYGALLGSGIEIFEYYKSFMHAKVAVVDGVWSTVGSSNIDPFSLVMSREANIVVYDADFSRQLLESLEQAMREGARGVPKQYWKQRPWIERVLIWVCYGLGRFFMGMFGFTPK
jgi:cardiolipin synthase A/B